MLLNLTVYNTVEPWYVIYSAQIFDITGRISFMKSVKNAEITSLPVIGSTFPLIFVSGSFVVDIHGKLTSSKFSLDRRIDSESSLEATRPS